THIGPKSQAAVLSTLRRAIADNGMLALTIRQAKYWEDEKWPDEAARAKLIEQHFAEGFAHIAGNIEGLNEFGNTTISVDYVRSEWTEWRLADVQWRAADPYQTIVFLRPA
ncbi:MAG: hypothetical protein ACREH4_16090, partial [Vitreimonas sp.]